MFTGRHPHELSTGWWVALNDRFPTLAEALTSYGYATGGFIANYVYCRKRFGLHRGFLHYEDFVPSFGQLARSSAAANRIIDSDRFRLATGFHDSPNRKSAAAVNAGFLTWLQSLHGQPFFAFLNYFDAHMPFLPPAPYDSKFGGPRPLGNIPPQHHASIENYREFSPEEIAIELNAYDGAIAYLDDQVGHLLDNLRTRGLLENTMVIITSDHGEEFLEHGVRGHGNSLYLCALHVPLLISFPGKVPMGLEVTEPVSLRDVSATVLDLLELASSGISGTSLAQYWNRSSESFPSTLPVLSEVGRAKFPLLEFYPVAKGNMKSLVIGPHHFIRNGEGYDTVEDPIEKRDMAGTSEGDRLIPQFGRLLDQVVSQT